ncbi:aldehyde ferredoxin oxidoreductase family protein [Candidatus Bathyarchaeota archaeon]|nr:aldehyde ferredoxin oxidoreductase family protein [Candidatus Bathyarchaeota archaeon]
MPFEYHVKILKIDLSREKVGIEEAPRWMVKLYLGGRGINAKLLHDLLPLGTDPYDAENPLIFGVGPLVGTLAPAGCRTRVTTLSPLTGFIGDSSIGGSWGAELRYAGFDHIVIVGRAERPIYLSIMDGECRIESAEELWGLKARETAEALREEIGDWEAKTLCIGPAGENLVRYACIVGDGYNVAGRTGVGAVMGSKRLKGIVVRGTLGVEVADPERFEELALKAHNLIRENPRFQSLSGIGLMRGMMQGYHGEEARRRLNPEEFLERYVYKRKTCFACPAHCLYHYMVPYGPHVGCYGGNFPANPLIEFGLKLGVDDWPSILKLNELSTDYGLDVDGAGSTIYFALELLENGVIDVEYLDGLCLREGDFDVIAELLRRIAYREGIGDLMAEGSRRMAARIGGVAEHYTREIKGLELMPGRLPHYFNALAHAVSGRGGCHTRSQCFVVTRYLTPEEAERRFGTSKAVEPRETEGKAKMLIYYEDLIAVGDSLGICSFFLGENCPALSFKELSELLEAATRIALTPRELRRCGERIINLERLINIREGLSREDDTIPPRLVTPNPEEWGEVERDLNRMLDEYYRLRGWKETGEPRGEKLRELQLEDDPYHITHNT